MTSGDDAETAFNEHRVKDLCRLLVESCSNDPDIGQAQQLVEFALDRGPLPNGVSAITGAFLNSIEKSKALSAGVPGTGTTSRMEIGVDMDFIGRLGGKANWNAAQFLNSMMMNRIEPTRTAAVVVPMRDDGIYILEYIAYYLSLGFEHLFIYTNDNSDHSEELLRLLASHGVITLIESTTSQSVPPEVKAFEHALHFVHDLRQFEWVLFVDSDEFLSTPRYDDSIVNVLAALKRRFGDALPAAVCYQWLWMISGMVYRREPRLLIERFQHATPHWLPKPLVRLREVVSMQHQHVPDVRPGGFVVDSNFDPIAVDDPLVWQKIRRPQYAGGFIRHYWTRSFEEYAIKKARGSTLRLADNEYDRPFDLFFAWNGFETAKNDYPVESDLLALVKDKLAALEGLDGVAAAVAKIESAFPAIVSRLNKDGQLRERYEALYPARLRELRLNA